MINLVGKSFTFDDGSTISVIQIKQKEIDSETLPIVTYTTSHGRGLPKKLQMPYTEFIAQFGHLFD